MAGQPNRIKPQKLSLLRLAPQLQPEIYIIINPPQYPECHHRLQQLLRNMDEGTSYTILRKRVDPELVRRARKALTKTLKDRRESVEEDVVFVNIFEKFEDWPDECKALLAEIKVSGNCLTP